MRRSDDSEGLAHLVIFSPDDLRGRQIDELHVSLRVNHKVLRLDIPAYNLIVIEVLQDLDDTRSVKLTILCRKQPNTSNNLIEILPAHILLKVEQIILSLEGPA